MKEESQNFQSCLNPLSLSAVPRPSLSSHRKLKHIRLNSRGASSSSLDHLQLWNTEKLPRLFLQGGEKSVQEWVILRSFQSWQKWVRNFPTFANVLAELKGTWVPQHLWFCGCHHFCFGQLGSSNIYPSSTCRSNLQAMWSSSFYIACPCYIATADRRSWHQHY